MGDQCKDCRHWCHIVADVGECRKKAPQHGPDGKWPRVQEKDWCGDYQDHPSEFGPFDDDDRPAGTPGWEGAGK